MKTLTKTGITTEKAYRIDKYPLITYVETTYECDGAKTTMRRFLLASGVDAAKQYLLFQARYPSPAELPYSLDRYSAIPDESPEDWWVNRIERGAHRQYGGLCVPKGRFTEYEDDILSLNMAKPNEALYQELKAKYAWPEANQKNVVEPDAVAIEED